MTIVFSSPGMLAGQCDRAETIQEQGNDESQTHQGQRLIGAVGAAGEHQGLRQKNEESHRDDGAGTEAARQMPAIADAPRKGGTGKVRQIRGPHDNDELNEWHVSLSDAETSSCDSAAAVPLPQRLPFLN